MLTVNVALGERSYPIHIGTGLLRNADLLSAHLGKAPVLVVTNETVAPLYLKQLADLLGANFRDAIILKDGEQYKTLTTVNEIYNRLLAGRFGRDSVLIALGGGVVGDITGFAAATYQRGIGFIQIPTTLLAQVDSSVGGKTGVNHALGKNMIGAFHQPLCVIADTQILNSLPDRELRAGVAEVIKYGLICDAGFFFWLRDNRVDLLNRYPEALARAIESSCRYKAEIVVKDEREGGVRALLNLGHTFGHAIETATGYSSWLHGEAVAVGMVMAADLSMRLGWIPVEKAQLIRHVLEKFGLPVVPPASISVTQFIDLMATDKKVKDQIIRFVLLRDIGRAVIENGIPQHLLVKTLNAGDSLCYA